MNAYLLEQLQNHPSMQPQDIVKLCYQAVYGAEHLLTDIERARQYFNEEFANTEPADIPVYEFISEQYARVNIAGWKYRGLPAADLLDLFLDTVKASNATEDFHSLMQEYLETARQVLSSDSFLELQAYLADYYAQGIRPVHHSEEYRLAESPHYRVVRRYLLIRWLERQTSHP